jgi:hypothetical protein
MKSLLSRAINAFGLQTSTFRGSREDAQPVLGSYAPLPEVFCVGRRENYFIHDGYHHRDATRYFDDTSAKVGEWQVEVYRFAREIADRDALTNVCDVGCGSARKLLRYFSDLTTVGVDVAETCTWLRRRHPDRLWIEEGPDARPPFPVDLVICADVIEHVLNPDSLLSYIAELSPRQIVISTPERNLLRRGTHNGPPSNPSHVREWNFTEWEAYLRAFFDVREHFISNASQATQCALCTPRSSPGS